MPLSNGIYSLPSGWQAVTGTTISSATYNLALSDVQAGINAVVDPQNLMPIIKANDGEGSGLDADKLDGHEAAAFVLGNGLLDAVKAVDGAGSGLDADTVDGQEAAYFQRALKDLAPGDIGTEAFAMNRSGSALGFGSEVQGSQLTLTSVAPGGQLITTGAQLTGRWRCKGGGVGDGYAATFERIE